MIYAGDKVFILSTPCFVLPTVDQVTNNGVSRFRASVRIFQKPIHGSPENEITVQRDKKTTDSGG